MNNIKKKYSPKEVAAFEGLFSLAKDGRPFSDIKVQDIATAAGIGKGTLYEYFSSKEDILSGAIIYALVKILEHLHQDLTEATTFQKCLERLFDELNGSEKLPIPEISSMVSSMPAEQSLAVKKQNSIYWEYIVDQTEQIATQMFEIGRHTGEIDATLDNAFCQYTMISAIFGQTTASRLVYDTQTYPNTRDRVVTMICRTLRP